MGNYLLIVGFIIYEKVERNVSKNEISFVECKWIKSSNK